MQGIHEGIGAKLLPTLLAAAPPPPPLLYPCATVSAPATSSAACALCTVLYSPSPCAFCFFLFIYFFDIALHRDTITTQSAFFFFFSKSKRSHLQLLRRLLDMDVSLCAPHLLYALAAMVFCLFVFHSVCFIFIFFSYCVFLNVYSRLHVCMRNTMIQTTSCFLTLLSRFIC